MVHEVLPMVAKQ